MPSIPWTDELRVAVMRHFEAFGEVLRSAGHSGPKTMEISGLHIFLSYDCDGGFSLGLPWDHFRDQPPAETVARAQAWITAQVDHE